MRSSLSPLGKRLLAALLAALCLAGGAILGLRAALPDTFYIAEGEEFSIASLPFLSARQARGAVAEASESGADKSRNTTLTVLGVLPVKTVRTVNAARRTVSTCGTPFGIKMFSNGALVVAFSDLYTARGSENPAKAAGLRLGDLIVSANGRSVRSNDDLTAAITAAAGEALQVEYLRDGEQYTCTLTPVTDRDTGAWRAGVWVRDSSAGIGTLTFTDAAHGTFAGLGHAISDSDTGAQISLLSGEIVPVTITGCVRGAAGAPGELRGEFAGGAALGTVLANDATGVYGALQGSVPGTACPVAEAQEVALGPAQILTTVDEGTPRLYDVEIERVNMTAADPNRNLLVRVTDPELLRKTGGIVQGMSGSHILQSGRLVGAVTHVLVNDPAHGYGIFARTMLTKADAIAG